MRELSRSSTLSSSPPVLPTCTSPMLCTSTTSNSPVEADTNETPAALPVDLAGVVVEPKSRVNPAETLDVLLLAGGEGGNKTSELLGVDDLPTAMSAMGAAGTLLATSLFSSTL